MTKQNHLALFLLAIAFFFGQTITAQAQLIVYEGFEYTADGNLGGQAGGTGFAAAWSTVNGTGPELTIGAGISSADIENTTGPSLATAGGNIMRVNRTNITTSSRVLDPTVVASIADGATLWGSFLYRHGNGNGFLADSSISLASQTTAVNNNHQLSVAGDGFGVLFGENNDDVQAVFWDNSDIADETATTTLTAVSGIAATVDMPIAQPRTTLIVFSIEFNPDGTADVMDLYSVTDISAALPAPFSTTTFDFDQARQSAINTLNIVEAQTGEFDEIRIGLDLASVLPAGTTGVLLGDVNLDETVNFLDISPFISVLSSGGNQAEADCNEDGGVNFLDIAPFITILSGQ